jgi:hypothetical protein
MAVRCTHDDVIGIMDNCQVNHAIIDTLIPIASGIIDKIFTGDSTMTTDMLKSIEMYLTAHIIASTLERTAAVEKIGDAAITYTGKWGKMLESTPYGQMILTLDITGKMAKTGLKGASIYAIPNFDA